MAEFAASSLREDNLPVADPPKAGLRVETLLQTVTDAFIQLDCDGRINGWNPRAEKIYHWSAAEAIGMSAEFLTPEEDRAEFSRLFHEWIASDKDLIFEDPWKYRARRRNGEVFVAQLTAARLRGEKPGLAFLVRDLTEHRALRDALVKTEERYQSVLRNIEEGYFEVDHSGVFTFLTDAFAETFGYTPAEMTGKSYKEFYPSEELPKIRTAFNTVWRTGTPRKSLECLIVCRDGSSRFIEDSVSLKRDRKGEPIGFIGIRRDITDRKLSEEALRASEAKWRDLFERASDLVYSTDAHGRITGMNPVGEQITGYSREELLGSSVRSFVAPESMMIYDQIRSEVLAGKAGTVHDIEIITKGGRRRPLELNVSLLLDKGKRIGVVGIARDMTSRRRAVRFEQGRAAILEGIARDVPLDSLLRDITALFDSELPGSCCAVIMRDRGVPRVVSAFSNVDVDARDLVEERSG
jgi:PAS domain S-box-containing protein